jgi:recombinational DNA repair protein (RecF pathway)
MADNIVALLNSMQLERIQLEERILGSCVLLSWSRCCECGRAVQQSHCSIYSSGDRGSDRFHGPFPGLIEAAALLAQCFQTGSSKQK